MYFVEIKKFIMKQKNLLIINFLLLFSYISNAQLNTGSIGFTALNTDGGKDFGIIALTDIPANSTIFITDNEVDGTGNGFNDDREGTIAWATGGTIITRGTIIVFTDVNNDGIRTVTTGSITEPDGGFNPSGAEALFAYLGSSFSEPTIFLGGIQVGTGDTSTVAGDLTGTGLELGTTFIKVGTTVSPDGIYYDSGSRTNKESFSGYHSLLGSAGNWTQNTTDGESTLPISTTAFSLSAPTGGTTTWTGGTSNWESSGNWDNGLPDATKTVIVANVGSSPIISDGTTALALNLTINTGATLTINSVNSLTVSGDFTNNGTLALSGGSIISKELNYGNITYNRNLGTDNWYLVSSPVRGEDMTDMRANNSFNTNGSSEVSFAPYDNSQAVAADRWSYFGNTSANALVDGKGYSAKLSASGNLTFGGIISSSDITIPLTQGGASGTNFNLLGNPFPSFINSGTFLTNESADLASETIWLWDQSGNGGAGEYITRVTVNAFKIAPGQGFFVEANTTNNVTFNESIQSHESSDTFLKTSRFEIKLILKEGSNSKYAEIYYINGTTTGFDNGYDGKLFSGVSHNFALYSNLVDNSDTEKYQVQSLPNSDYENMVIPIGIIAEAGKEITFTAEALNLPTGLKVFLEDRLTNTFTRLDEANSAYTVALNEKLDGVGRFYVHTKVSALNIDEVQMENISIYTSNASTLRIVGLPQGKASIQLFNILGKQVLQTSFTSNGAKDITLPNVSAGIYIVQLKTATGQLNQKITLD